MKRCQQCQGQLRLSRALRKLECMECAAQFEPNAVAVAAAVSSEALAAPINVVDAPAEKPHITVRPECLTLVNRSSSSLCFSLHRQSPLRGGLLFISLVWAGLAALMISQLQGPFWVVWFFEMLFGGSALYLLLLALSAFINHQVISIDQSEFRLRNRPFPIGDLRFSRADVSQLYLSELPSFTEVNLGLLLRDGRQQRLLPMLDRSVALYLEQQLEGFWGIIDDPNADEPYTDGPEPEGSDDSDDIVFILGD